MSSLAKGLIVLGALASLLPFVPVGAALVAGAALGLMLGNPFAAATRSLSKRLLALSVVGLGAGTDLGVVARVGAQGLVGTVVGIAFCLLLGTWLARWLAVAPNTGLLLSVGTAICGGSAIAAVAPVVRASDDEVAVSLATVFLLNAVGLFVFPLVGHALAMTPVRFGWWAALAIHDTSSVVGAAMSYGGGALAIATTVKLARAVWIAPVALVIGALVARVDGSTATPPGAGPKSPRPWFILGFLAAAALVTVVPALAPLGHQVSALARQVMACTLFLIGAGLTRSALRSVGLRPLLHGLLLWVVVGSLSLASVQLGLFD